MILLYRMNRVIIKQIIIILIVNMNNKKHKHIKYYPDVIN